MDTPIPPMKRITQRAMCVVSPATAGLQIDRVSAPGNVDPEGVALTLMRIAIELDGQTGPLAVVFTVASDVDLVIGELQKARAAVWPSAPRRSS